MAAVSLVVKPRVWQSPKLHGHTPRRGSGVVRCSLQGAVVGNRPEWLTSCAVLSSKVAALVPHCTHGHVALAAAATNGAVLDLAPVSNIDGNLPAPLRIADLSPAPMHGSLL